MGGALAGVVGVESYELRDGGGSVLVSTTLPYTRVQAVIEGAGVEAVLKGYGGGAGMYCRAASYITGNTGVVTAGTKGKVRSSGKNVKLKRMSRP